MSNAEENIWHEIKELRTDLDGLKQRTLKLEQEKFDRQRMTEELRIMQQRSEERMDEIKNELETIRKAVTA